MGSKVYFFCMAVTHYRTGKDIGTRCGVVFATSLEEAEKIAWSKYGNDYTHNLSVEEVQGDGVCVDL